MIETKKFEQSQKSFFKIVLNTRLRKKWWLDSLLIIIGLFHLYLYFKQSQLENLIWCMICLLFPVITYISLYRFAYSKNQQIFLTERKVLFDSEIIKIVETEGSTNEIPYKKIIKIRSLEEYWMLYLNKNNYFYIPKNIFYKKEDFEKFKEYINQ